MISPVTVAGFPGTGLPSTAAPIVVAVQGCEGFSPSVPMGLSQPPSGVICGWSTPPEDLWAAAFLPSDFFSSAAVRVRARAATVRVAKNVFCDIVLLDSKMEYYRKNYFTWKWGKEKWRVSVLGDAQPRSSDSSGSMCA